MNTSERHKHIGKEIFLRILGIPFICLFLLSGCAQTPITPKNSSIVIPSTTGNVPTDLPTKDTLIETPSPTKVPPEFPNYPTQIYIPTSDYEPQKGDAKLSRDNANLEYASFQILESQPIQVNLELQGYLPTPCHKLRVAALFPDAENRIMVEVYSVYSADMMCIDVIKPFEINVPLGSFPSGHYKVWINNELIGEFDS